MTLKGLRGAPGNDGPRPDLMKQISRHGELIEADEVFEAWSSGDLPRMIAAANLPTHPVDRHFLLMNIVESARRKHDYGLVEQFARQHLDELPELLPDLKKEWKGRVLAIGDSLLTWVKSLEEQARHDDAIAICHEAINFLAPHKQEKPIQTRLSRLLKKAGRA